MNISLIDYRWNGLIEWIGFKFLTWIWLRGLTWPDLLSLIYGVWWSYNTVCLLFVHGIILEVLVSTPILFTSGHCLIVIIL